MKKIAAIMITCAAALTANAQALTATARQTQPQAEWTVTIAIEGGLIDYAAMMLDVELANHTITAVATAEGMAEHAVRTAAVAPAHSEDASHECTRITAYSATGATFTANGAPLLTLTVAPQAGEATLPEGDYDLFIQNIVLADFDGNESTLDPAQFVITSSKTNADAITSLSESEVAKDAYDLTGRKTRTTTGLHIKGGKKVVGRR